MKRKASNACRSSTAALIVWLTVLSLARAAELPNSLITPASSSNTNAGFSSAIEALGMMIQVVAKLEETVRSNDLVSIHSEDLVLNESLAAILQEADRLEPARREPFRVDVTRLGRHVGALHLAGDTQQQDLAEKTLRSVIEAFDGIKTYFPTATVALAQEAASQYLCPAHRDVRGKRTDFCPKCGLAMDQQVRLVPAFCGFSVPSKQSIRASVRTDRPLVKGEPANAFLCLSKADDSPVYPYDLITTHTEKIHLLIIDPSLSDYHHEHPRPTAVAGEYAFPFTPRKPGSYFVWADLRPQPMGLQQFATATIPGTSAGEPLVDRSVTNKAIVEGLNYELIFATDPLQVERPIPGKLRITRPDGTPFTRLEPIMASFAHLVGFNEDCKTVLHLHPQGPPVLNPSERGGPELEFRLYATKPGFVRLFAQVQIGGTSRFAPFGIRIVR